MVKVFVIGDLNLNSSFDAFEKISTKLKLLDDPEVLKYALEHYCNLNQATWEILLKTILNQLTDDYCIVTEVITYLSDELPKFDSTKIIKLSSHHHCYYVPKNAKFEIELSQVDYTVEEEIVASYV